MILGIRNRVNVFSAGEKLTPILIFVNEKLRWGSFSWGTVPLQKMPVADSAQFGRKLAFVLRHVGCPRTVLVTLQNRGGFVGRFGGRRVSIFGQKRSTIFMSSVGTIAVAWHRWNFPRGAVSWGRCSNGVVGLRRSGCYPAQGGTGPYRNRKQQVLEIK